MTDMYWEICGITYMRSACCNAPIEYLTSNLRITRASYRCVKCEQAGCASRTIGSDYRDEYTNLIEILEP